MKPPQHSYSWMHPALEVRDTGKYGFGVFATAAIPQETLLIACGGPILTIEDENQLPDECADLPIEISEWHSIGPRTAEEIPLMPQHYVNHSCNPNAGWKGQIFLMAMSDIQPGEEITYDYAMVMHSNPQSASYWTMRCLCGSILCRRDIAEDDWTRPELQTRYDGWFNWHLQQKVDALKSKNALTRGGGGKMPENRTWKVWRLAMGRLPAPAEKLPEKRNRTFRGVSHSTTYFGLCSGRTRDASCGGGIRRWDPNHGRSGHRTFGLRNRLSRQNQSLLRSQFGHHRTDLSCDSSRHPSGRGTLLRLCNVPISGTQRPALSNGMPVRVVTLPRHRQGYRLANPGTARALQRLVFVAYRNQVGWDKTSSLFSMTIKRHFSQLYPYANQ